MMYLLFFIIIFICSNPTIQQLFANVIGKQQPDVLSGFSLAFLLCVFAILIYNIKYQTNDDGEHINEPFLFQVSKFNPRCSGLYYGKPTTFQYDRIGCNYNKPVGGNPDMIQNVQDSDTSIKGYCTPEANPPLGYIASNKDQLYNGDPHMFPNFGDKDL